jgi:hypothetical protein
VNATVKHPEKPFEFVSTISAVNVGQARPDEICGAVQSCFLNRSKLRERSDLREQWDFVRRSLTYDSTRCEQVFIASSMYYQTAGDIGPLEFSK